MASPGSIITTNSQQLINTEGYINDKKRGAVMVERIALRNYINRGLFVKSVGISPFKSFKNTEINPEPVMYTDINSVPENIKEFARQLYLHRGVNPTDADLLYKINSFGKKRFIQEVNRRSALKNTVGSFRSWCQSQRLADSR